ncbi:DUF418 domain-containing protein [Bordetella bronchiseptica]|uniref:DUF418 domain-containing protein n=1 Tax=Bordetella bronchiseptica TaxID=518 RepID=UPI00143E2237|nr:DUF418 domain-containing protein [Bordetella bronchiseptica]QIY02685.1 DUF418 domain-containing protein [Bordetella bronchiseptica]
MNDGTAAQRLAHLDALRGFALFGILVVNIGVFASVYYGTGLPDPAFSRPLDQWVNVLVAVLFESKFYLLFSFLFGYSFTLQIDAAQRAGAAFAPRFLRRLAGLAVLGLAHAVLLYHGDILLTYAVLGALLLVLRRTAPERALRWACWLALLAGLGWLALGVLSLMTPQDPATLALTQEDALAALQAYRGTIGTTIARHIHDLTHGVWMVVLLVQGPFVLAMFLAGLALGRRHALADPLAHPRLLRAVLAVGLPLGAAGAAVYAWSGLPGQPLGIDLIGLGAGMLTAPLLSASYAAALLLAMRRPAGARLARWLAPAGRMALTNYLLQSLVCAVLFTAWGLRWVGTLAPLSVLGLAVLVFALQLPWSAWWLRRHAYGPVEWLLRALTLARWPAWRIEPPPAARR